MDQSLKGQPRHCKGRQNHIVGLNQGWNKVFRKGVKKETIGEGLPHLEMTEILKNEKKEDMKKMFPYLNEENKDFYNELVQ